MVWGTSVSGFIDTGGIFTTLDAFGSYSTFALGINDAGSAVGYFGHNGSTSGFLYSNGNYRQLDDPLSGPSGYTIATGINNNGQIVGDFYDGISERGFLYSNGTYDTISEPASSGLTLVRGINNYGTVIGDYYYNSGTGTPFTYSNGMYSPVLDGSAYVLGINDAGTIVGYRQATLTMNAGVPEPSTWALLLVGIGGLGAVMRNRRRVIATA